MTRAVVSREAYGVRGACSRCRMCGAVRKREQAPRTPYASRGLVPVMPAWGQTRPTVAVRFTAAGRREEMLRRGSIVRVDVFLSKFKVQRSRFNVAEGRGSRVEEVTRNTPV